MTERAELDRANALFESGRLSESAAACRAYLGKSPNDAAAVRLYARIAEGMGMSSEAIVVYRRLLELIPNDADALNAIAWHLNQNGDQSFGSFSFICCGIQWHP